MMMTGNSDIKRLCWMQRIALVRHSLHAAIRTNDFTFFKNLQAQSFLDGTDHVAILGNLIGSEVDTVLHTLDDLNAGVAYVCQDAFKVVYDNIRASVAEDTDARRAKIRVDISQQKQVADFGIDKMANAAIQLIESQNQGCQEAVANVWLFGASIITDAVQAVVLQMDKLELIMDDFILLEYSWQNVQGAVEASVSALRAIFNLMASSESGTSLIKNDRSMSTMSGHSRTTSVSSATGSLFKRLSIALSPHQSLAPPPAPPGSARNSVISAESPQQLRHSVSNSFPSHVPISKPEYQRRLSTIPPTPFESNVNPFDNTSNFSSGQSESPFNQSSTSPLDYDPMDDTTIVKQEPTFFRRLSRDLGPRAIAV